MQSNAYEHLCKVLSIDKKNIRTTLKDNKNNHKHYTLQGKTMICSCHRNLVSILCGIFFPALSKYLKFNKIYFKMWLTRLCYINTSIRLFIYFFFVSFFEFVYLWALVLNMFVLNNHPVAFQRYHKNQKKTMHTLGEQILHMSRREKL